MNQLDDFEKYLRDQLKGHVQPEPLMWKRLNDVLGHVQPWYARSAFKYALTACGAMIFGAISTYLYMEKQSSPSLQQTSTSTTASATAAKNNSQTLSKTTAASPHFAAALPIQTAHIDALSIAKVADHLQSASIYKQTEERKLSGDLKIREPLFDANSSEAQDSLLAQALLPNLPISKLNTKHLTLQSARLVNPGLHRLSISIATARMQANLPAFDYQLGNSGTHQAKQSLEASPLLQLQFLLHKNWSINAGIQQQQTNLTEHFYQTSVYSFDEKEHFLFPYLYGFRQISDEELHEGPWPLGPNPPGGQENPNVKANFTSTVQQQQIVIPLTLSYHKQFGVFEAQLHAGLALRFNYKTTQTLLIPGYLPSSVFLFNQNGRMQTMAQTELRLSYLASPHLAVYLEPQIRTSIQQQNEVHSSPYRTNSRALFAGICWKF